MFIRFLLVDFGLAQHVEEIKAEYCDSPVDKKRKRSEDEVSGLISWNLRDSLIS